MCNWESFKTSISNIQCGCASLVYFPIVQCLFVRLSVCLLQNPPTALNQSFHLTTTFTTISQSSDSHQPVISQSVTDWWLTDNWSTDDWLTTDSIIITFIFNKHPSLSRLLRLFVLFISATPLYSYWRTIYTPLVGSKLLNKLVVSIAQHGCSRVPAWRPFLCLLGMSRVSQKKFGDPRSMRRTQR